MVYITACLSVAFNVYDISSLIPLPIGPLSSLLPIIDPWIDTTASPPWLQVGFEPFLSSVLLVSALYIPLLGLSLFIELLSFEQIPYGTNIVWSLLQDKVADLFSWINAPLPPPSHPLLIFSAFGVLTTNGWLFPPVP